MTDVYNKASNLVLFLTNNSQFTLYYYKSIKSYFMFKLHKFITAYNDPAFDKTEFYSLYMYLLYVCGGDFSMFDDQTLLKSALMANTH